MAEHDDGFTSVRVELDGAPHGDLEIPEMESQPTRGAALSAIAGLIVVIALGLVLFGLSPDDDEAADGTLREAPSTTTPDHTFRIADARRAHRGAHGPRF